MREMLRMRPEDLDRLEVLQAIKNKKFTKIEGAKLLKVSDRQLRRIWKRFRTEGRKGVVPRNTGKPSNRRLSQNLLDRVLSLIKAQYRDCGPTFVHEKLTEKHHLKISRESIRQLMISKHLWISKAHKGVIHRLRPRREAFGELIRIDASHHAWFEDRGPKCILIVFIDDATSMITSLHFAPTECLEAYFITMKNHILRYDRPLAVYADRHSIFCSTKKSPQQEKTRTQFGRAMKELDIDLIYAHSPQAKGRVERANRTLQDRLIKEMRFRNISDIEHGNAFLEQFRKDYNRRFAIPRTQKVDLHRPLGKDHCLEKILSVNEIRIVQKDLTLQYESTTYQIMNVTEARRFQGKKVLIWKDSSHQLHFECDKMALEVKSRAEIPFEDAKIINLNCWKDRKHFIPKPSHPYKSFKI